jgi:hypothetical protein
MAAQTDAGAPPVVPRLLSALRMFDLTSRHLGATLKIGLAGVNRLRAAWLPDIILSALSA